MLDFLEKLLLTVSLNLIADLITDAIKRYFYNRLH